MKTLGLSLSTLLFSLSMTVTCFATDMATVIAANVRQSTITGVSLAPIPHDDSLLLVIKTTTGQHNIIVTRENLPLALAALKNPAITGKQNAVIADDIIHNGPLLTFIPHAAPSLSSNPTVPNPEVVNPAMENQAPSMMPESAPAEVAATIQSANQQASR